MSTNLGRLAGRSAIITGGASGIGRSTAEVFAAEGACVVIMDNAEAEGSAVEQLLCESGAEAMFLAGDVSRPKDVRRLMDETMRRYGRIDVLFNNAGYNQHRPIVQVSEKDWRRLLQVNLGSVFLCSKYAIPHMIRAGRGSIINNASSLGLIGFPNVPAYSASKGAIVALTRQMAVDYSKSGIRVNCVCPGPTLTPRIQRDLDSGAITPDVRERMTADVLLGRMGQPREIANAVAFLASDEASFITGVALAVDGGQTAH